MTFWEALTFILLGAAISFVDIREQRIPNTLVGVLFLAGVFFTLSENRSPWPPLALMAGLMGGALLLRFFCTKLCKGDALGLGDVKLFGALAWWICPGDVPFFLIFSGLCGLMIGLLWRSLTGQKTFPFAPALFLGYALLSLGKIFREDLFLPSFYH